MGIIFGAYLYHQNNMSSVVLIVINLSGITALASRVAAAAREMKLRLVSEFDNEFSINIRVVVMIVNIVNTNTVYVLKTLNVG